MSARIVVAAAIAAALTLVACGGQGTTDRKESPQPKVAALREAWSVKPGALWNAPPNDTAPWAWTTETSLIVPGKKTLTSYSASDGTEQWTVKLPRSVCGVADAPNPAGIGAVLLSGGTKVNPEACGAVAAVDTRAGRVLWTKSLRGRSSYGLTDVQVGPEAVAITEPVRPGRHAVGAHRRSARGVPRAGEQRVLPLLRQRRPRRGRRAQARRPRGGRRLRRGVGQEALVRPGPRRRPRSRRAADRRAGHLELAARHRRLDQLPSLPLPRRPEGSRRHAVRAAGRRFVRPGVHSSAGFPRRGAVRRVARALRL